MQKFHWPLFIVEVINSLFTIFIVIFFTIHTCKLKKLAETQRFIHLYPYNRAIFVVIFVLINLAQIIILTVTNKLKDLKMNSIEVIFAIGTITNSCVLIFQLYIMRLEIKKEYPYSPIHRMYWIYLPCISSIRLILQCILEANNKMDYAIIGLSISLVIDSIGLFFYSIFFKRQEISQIQKIKGEKYELNISIINEETLFNHIPESNIDDNFPLLNLKIKNQQSQYQITVCYKSDILTRKTFTHQEIYDFYQNTQHFNLRTKLAFINFRVDRKDLESFFKQLLNDWQNYQSFVLDFLGLPEDQKYIYFQEYKKMQQQNKYVDKSLKDKNSIYFNVFIPKVKKRNDHYEFCIIITTSDGKYRTQVQKRYTEIQQLDVKLRTIDIKTAYNTFNIKTPEFPQKHYFNHHDIELIEQRKQKLQLYLRRIMNDKNLVKRYREISQILFEFLEIQPNIDIHDGIADHYVKLTFEKGTIVNGMQKNEYVTYYYFMIRQKDLFLKKIRKRFSEFDGFHQEIKRWMHNTQIQYKLIILPSKFLNRNITYKQKQVRHKQLCDYLNMIAELPNIHEIYQYKRFLELDNADQIITNQSEFQSPKLQQIQYYDTKDQEELDYSMNKMNKMSLLIDQLGDNI